jgi:prepilin-type N-terminal cleavage/methylation domain-containing protein/prepilin-type processing-associated H-X9-DG protein
LKSYFRRDQVHTDEQNGYTLPELLVTISVIGGLMAILLPAMQCVRKQAKTMGCQSNQRQWGVGFTIDDEPVSYLDRFQPFLRTYIDYNRMDRNSLRTDANDIYLCPSAKKIGRPVPSSAPAYLNLEAWDGSKSTAWAYKFMGQLFTSSYSVNTMREDIRMRKAIPAEKPSEVPILFDSTFRLTGLVESDDPPPQYDDMPRGIPTYKDTRACGICIDRHNGGINILLMDASVRKVELKELWTLRWNDQFNKAGPWTKAGGVRAQDWPEWMRRFRDY